MRFMRDHCGAAKIQAGVPIHRLPTQLRNSAFDLAATSQGQVYCYIVHQILKSVSKINSFDDETEPKPADLIQVFRPCFQHWAVYIGDGDVVHLTSDSQNSGCDIGGCGTNNNKGMVKIEKLKKVLGNSKYKINNILDEKNKPRPANVVLKEARRLVGSEKPYCFLWKNCEHFATELRYGKPESRQV
ncbi:HRAS-like suppressor 3 [Merluccius polli]|uniref:HRAS-like suppressor 3 n=1 Tax=Merluccius polli TaxID=89951 RepID=A0AA47PD10_MERPO|nr:HRAS-like suppressor 3 [Merluccius polli]